MNTNQISAALSDQAVTNIKKSINDIRQQLPFLVTLTADERRTLPKMGDVTLNFVGKAISYMENNATLVPPFVNVAEARKDYELANKLLVLVQLMEQLTSQSDDTLMLAGSEAYVASLSFYNSVKYAAGKGIPGAKEAYDELRKRFPAHAAATPATPPTQA